MKSLFGLLLAFSFSAFAGWPTDRTFMCTVESFDAKSAKLACDPRKPKDKMATPREWLGKDQALKAGSTVKFSLDDKQFEKWLVMNKSPMAKEIKK